MLEFGAPDSRQHFVREQRQALQRDVAGRVAIAVVDLLEMVDVDHDDAERHRMAAIVDIERRFIKRMPAIIRAGQLIGDGQLAQRVLRTLLVGDVLHQHLHHRIAGPRQAARNHLHQPRRASADLDHRLDLEHLLFGRERRPQLRLHHGDISTPQKIEHVLAGEPLRIAAEQIAARAVGEQDPLLGMDQ